MLQLAARVQLCLQERTAALPPLQGGPLPRSLSILQDSLHRSYDSAAERKEVPPSAGGFHVLRTAGEYRAGVRGCGFQVLMCLPGGGPLPGTRRTPVCSASRQWWQGCAACPARSQQRRLAQLGLAALCSRSPVTVLWGGWAGYHVQHADPGR